MRLVRLLYYSVREGSLSTPEVQALLRCSTENNQKQQLTGFLAFSETHFLQVLEGPSRAINDLYARILRDPRHKEVTLMDYTEIPKRSFQEWSMEGLSMDQVRASLHLPDVPELRPELMTAPTALSLLEELSQLRQQSLQEHPAPSWSGRRQQA